MRLVFSNERTNLFRLSVYTKTHDILQLRVGKHQWYKIHNCLEVKLLVEARGGTFKCFA